MPLYLAAGLKVALAGAADGLGIRSRQDRPLDLPVVPTFSAPPTDRASPGDRQPRSTCVDATVTRYSRRVLAARAFPEVRRRAWLKPGFWAYSGCPSQPILRRSFRNTRGHRKALFTDGLGDCTGRPRSSEHPSGSALACFGSASRHLHPRQQLRRKRGVFG